MRAEDRYHVPLYCDLFRRPPMAEFNRLDICCAYAALEYDWNVGGMLQERASNQRRRESIGVQLHRMNFKAAGDEAAGFSELVKGGDGPNRAEIYLDAICRMGLAGQVSPKDEIATYVCDNFKPEFVQANFPHLAQAKQPRP